MSKVMRAIGLMSGTSMDGIDIALIETDGLDHVRRLASDSIPYSDAFRGQLRQALADAKMLIHRDARPGCLAAVERELTQLHADAVLRFMGDRLLQPSAVDVLGFHGQTVLHRPEAGLTVQLGDGAALARSTGIDVVFDLRAADVAAGGQGAPLVPVYHRALAVKVRQRPVAFVNIGGVANVTWIGRDGTLIAFDTGPGNALIDDWMLRHTGMPRDDGGTLAASGRVIPDVVAEYLAAPYFLKPAPKSLDRNAFSPELASNLGSADGAATLTAVTAESIARSRAHFPESPCLWAICGGGRHNRTLMSMLVGLLESPVIAAEELDLDGDTMEAEAWAYLAVRSLQGLPITFPGTTGTPSAATGGVLAKSP